MFIEQLRCDYDVSELLQEEYILGPTKPTVDSSLYVVILSTTLKVTMGLYALPSKCCAYGPQRPSLEETPEQVFVRVFHATFDAGLVDFVGRKRSFPPVLVTRWLSLLKSIHDCSRLCLYSL